MPAQSFPEGDRHAGAVRLLRGTVLVALYASPFVALAVLPSLYFPAVTAKGFAFRALVEVAFAAWICLAVLDARWRPRGSAILVSFAAFLVVMAAADALGSDPERSFFGGFVRMEGFAMLLHLFAFFLVAGTMLRSASAWRRYFATSVGASVLVACVGLLQRAGILAAPWGIGRVDATFGNPAYLATYLLIHVFLAAHLGLGARHRWTRAAFAAALAVDLAVLWLTATRGAVVGLACGAVVAAFLVLRRHDARTTERRVAAGVLLFVALGVAALAALRLAPNIAGNAMLARFAAAGTAADTLDTRSRIWAIAGQGVRARPVLGWGQENFITVFERKFDPVLARDTEWADRAHNVVLDWLIAGGALGALGYLSLYGASLWTVWSRPESRLAPALLTGLLAGYFVDLLSFFDNVASYATFAALLASWHASAVRDAAPAPARALGRIGAGAMIAASAVALAAALAVDTRGLLAAASLRSALNAGAVPTIVTAPAAGTVLFTPPSTAAAPGLQRDLFRKALSYRSFGTTEIREQLALVAYGRLLTGADTLASDTLAADAIAAAQAQLDATPDAVRFRLFLGGLYVVTGRFDDAIATLAPARALAPRRQSILQMLASAYQGKGETAKALNLLQRALDLDPGNDAVRLAFAATAIDTGDSARGEALLVARYGTDLVPDDRIIAAFERTGSFDKVVALWRMRVASDPQNKDYHVELAGALMRAGHGSEAMQELHKLNDVLRPPAPAPAPP